MIAALLDQTFRRESGTVLAALIRTLGDFERAEDALQDACARALETWPRDGVPSNPAAWLTTVARRRALDQRRRAEPSPLPADLVGPLNDEELGPAAASGIADDRLRLLFTCCHPALAQPARVALALKTLGGLTTREIARAFVEPEATAAQRLVRAKAKIREAGIPYIVPEPADLPDRLAAVLEVVYLIFNEGYAAAHADGLVRPDLCREAIRLGRLAAELMPDEPEVHGLLALMLLHDARRPGRLTDAGELIPLEDQDRSRWDRTVIAEGVTMLDTVLALGRAGPYQIQAAVAALHATAPTAADTDWMQIAALYAGLLGHAPTPVIELNAAVAIAMAGRTADGLAWIDRLTVSGELDGYHLLPAAQADLLRRLGRNEEAVIAYRQALEWVTASAERRYLERRLAEVEGERGPP